MSNRATLIQDIATIVAYGSRVEISESVIENTLYTSRGARALESARIDLADLSIAAERKLVREITGNARRLRAQRERYEATTEGR
jgi:hypothetical protein